MRYLKFFVLTVLFVLSMLFFVENTATLSNPVQLELNLVFARLYSVPMPFYLAVLIAFLAGALFCLACFVLDRIRLGRELKALRKRASALEDELLALRTKPLAGQSPEQAGGQEQLPGQTAGQDDAQQPLRL